MPIDDDMKIEGDLSKKKPWSLWRVGLNGEKIDLVAEADTREELDKVHRRLDWRYKIYLGRKPVD
jgi:hypothetical protein